MGFTVRKSIKLGPVNVTVSSKGISTSIGAKGVRVTKKANGQTTLNASIPGTGLRYTKNLGGKKKRG